MQPKEMLQAVMETMKAVVEAMEAVMEVTKAAPHDSLHESWIATTSKLYMKL